MVCTNEIVIDKIKKACKPEDVSMILDKFVTRQAKKNNRGRIARISTLSILLMLEFHKSKEMEPLALQNLKLAITIVKNIDDSIKQRNRLLWD